jgi:transketolase
MNEGQIWEALMLLGKSKLPNVIVIVDRNRIQIDGDTEDVMPLEPLASKLESFNLNVVSINGNDINEICNSIENAKLARVNNINKSTVIIANTIAGKGIESIEGDYKWHGKAPNTKEGEIAINNLRTLYGRLNNG